jgi:hypothetical protein
MLAHTATRFAESSLALYAHEGTFATGVDSEDEIEPIAQAFEQLGCRVEREPLRLRLKVTVGDQALTAVR